MVNERRVAAAAKVCRAAERDANIIASAEVVVVARRVNRRAQNAVCGSRAVAARHRAEPRGIYARRGGTRRNASARAFSRLA